MSASLPHPQGRCSVEPRRFKGVRKWLPLVDGAPAEGGATEDHHFDFVCDAIQVARRLSTRRMMENA